MLVGLTAGIAGCGGGGGGGSPPPAPIDAPFTSFQDVQPNHRYAIPGISQTASGAINNMGIVMPPATVNPADTTNSSVTITYDANSIPSVIAISTPQSAVTFDKSTGNSLVCSATSCTGTTPTAAGGAINPIGVGWNYQTFGFWAQTPTSTTWIAGAVSVGAPTPASAVPTTGNATFTGAAGGLYVDSVGNVMGTAANMTANVNFTNQTIGFGTSGTTVINSNGSSSSAPTLDLSGTLTYSPGTNGFSGAVTTADPTNPLNGTATGQFYGPNAQEIGGTYGLSSGTSVSRMVGAFGGKQ